MSYCFKTNVSYALSKVLIWQRHSQMDTWQTHLSGLKHVWQWGQNPYGLADSDVKTYYERA